MTSAAGHGYTIMRNFICAHYRTLNRKRATYLMSLNSYKLRTYNLERTTLCIESVIARVSPSNPTFSETTQRRKISNSAVRRGAFYFLNKKVLPINSATQFSDLKSEN